VRNIYKTSLALNHAYPPLPMVCLGALFGCKRSNSIVGYLLSTLITIAILCVLRLLCYGFYRFLKRRDSCIGEQQNGSLQVQSENTRQ